MCIFCNFSCECVFDSKIEILKGYIRENLFKIYIIWKILLIICLFLLWYILLNMFGVCNNFFLL